MNRTVFSISEALAFGFNRVFDHVILFFLVAVTQWFTYFLQWLCFALIAMDDFTRSFTLKTLGPTSVVHVQEFFYNTATTQALLAMGSIYLIFRLLESAYSLGLVRITLDIYDTNMSSYSRLFWFVKHIKRILTDIAATFIYTFLVGLGLVLFIIPGIILSIGFLFYRHLIVDKDMGVIDALTYSFRLTRGARFKLLGLCLTLSFVNLAGLLLLGIGLLITLPASHLALTYAYRKLLHYHEAAIS